MVQPVFQHESCYTSRGKPASHIVAFTVHRQKDVAAAWSNYDGGPNGYRAIRDEDQGSCFTFRCLFCLGAEYRRGYGSVLLPSCGELILSHGS